MRKEKKVKATEDTCECHCAAATSEKRLKNSELIEFDAAPLAQHSGATRS